MTHRQFIATILIMLGAFSFICWFMFKDVRHYARLEYERELECERRGGVWVSIAKGDEVRGGMLALHTSGCYRVTLEPLQ